MPLDDTMNSETELEENCSRERIVVMIRVRWPATYPDSFDLEPAGSALVFFLLKEFARSPPPRPACINSSFSEKQAQETFYGAMSAMRQMRILFDSISFSDTAVSQAASEVAGCLLMLQSPARRSRRKCISCFDPAVAAPCVDGGTNIVEVQYNRYCDSGYTTIEAVSILPPLREFHAPMLCQWHQLEFRTLIYDVMAPSAWSVAQYVRTRNSTGRSFPRTIARQASGMAPRTPS